MTASIISICNSALIKIGAERISSLNEENKRARLCKEQYEKNRDEVLRSHPWNFATKRVQLSLLTSVPAFEYSKEYNLPSDCLKVLKVYPDVKYKVEGRKILCNSSTLSLQYIFKNEDVYTYDSTFLEVLSAKIAVDLSYSMVQSITFKQELLAEYERLLMNARLQDAQEDTADDPIDDVWLNARTYGIIDNGTI